MTERLEALGKERDTLKEFQANSVTHTQKVRLNAKAMVSVAGHEPGTNGYACTVRWLLLHAARYFYVVRFIASCSKRYLLLYLNRYHVLNACYSLLSDVARSFLSVFHHLLYCSYAIFFVTLNIALDSMSFVTLNSTCRSLPLVVGCSSSFVTVRCSLLYVVRYCTLFVVF